MINISTNNFGVYLLSHLSQQIIPIIITSLTICIASISLRYSLVVWNRNNLFDKIITINNFTDSYFLRIWAYLVVIFSVLMSICWPLLITAATTSHQTVEIINSTIDIKSFLINTSSDIMNGDMTTVLSLNTNEYLNATCASLIGNMGTNVYNCQTNNKYDLEPLGFSYHSYNSDLMGYNIMIDVADPALSTGSNYYSHSIGTLDFNGSNITKSDTNMGWRFDVGPKNMTIHPTDERLLGTAYVIPINNDTQSVMSPFHRLSGDINYRMMSSDYSSNFSTTSLINDDENIGIFISTVQNQHTWFISGNYSTAIKSFLNETSSFIKPVPKLNITDDYINSRCPISSYSYCGYAINIKNFENDNMTDIIAFFGQSLGGKMVSVSTTTYYTSLANYTQNMTIHEPYYLQGSLYKYLNNKTTDRYRVLYAVNSPFNIYEMDNDVGSGVIKDMLYNRNELDNIKDKIINYMIIQNGGTIKYQYDNIHAIVVFENWFKYLSITIIVIGVLLFVSTRLFINKMYSKTIIDIINRGKKMEIYLEIKPQPYLRIGHKKISIEKLDEENVMINETIFEESKNNK